MKYNTVFLSAFIVSLITNTFAFKEIGIEKSILFIGNSYSGYPDIVLNKRIKECLNISPTPITVTSDISWGGGKVLKWHWDSTSAPKTIKSGKYKLIVLQGYTDAQSNYSEFEKYIGLFKGIADSVGARIVLYHPQHRNAGSKQDDAKVKALHENYNKAGVKFSIPVIHAGTLLNYLVDTYPSVKWFIPDDIRYHYDQDGALAATLFFYCAFTGKSPIGHAYTGGRNAEVVKIAQQAAWKFINQYPPYSHLGDHGDTTIHTDSSTFTDTTDDSSQTLISSLSPTSYETDKSFVEGADLYIDSDDIASQLFDGYSRTQYQFIRTSIQDNVKNATTFLTFTTNKPTTVFIGIVNGESVPQWLASWTLTTQKISSNKNKTYNLYKKSFPAQKIVLAGRAGKAQETMYIVFVKQDGTVGQQPILTVSPVWHPRQMKPSYFSLTGRLVFADRAPSSIIAPQIIVTKTDRAKQMLLHKR